MKVIHVCLGNFFADKASYQENLLIKYQVKMGLDVEVITSTYTISEQGTFIYLEQGCSYCNDEGVKVHRLEYAIPGKIGHIIKKYKNVYETLLSTNADIIFIHGCQFMDAISIIKYAKRYNIRIYVDNHADLYNSAQNLISLIFLHKFLWKISAQILEPYTKKFYGVVPARVDFLHEIYRVPKDKCHLLEMGADDELVEEVKRNHLRELIRKKYEIGKDELLIVTGGKINHNRPEVINLLKAVILIQKDNLKIKCIFFGNVEAGYKKEFEAIISNGSIIDIGWISSADIYKYLEAADLVAFPGLHSVLWEQAVGCGKACLFRRIKGFEHIDLNGNCMYFDDLSVEGMKKSLSIALEEGRLRKMTLVAENKGMETFSYKDIARRSISE